MILLIEDERGLLPQGAPEYMNRAAEAALRAESEVNARASLMAVTDEEIRDLNRRMRGIDRVTDVLSFPEISYPAGKTLKDCPSLIKRTYDPSLGAYFLGDIAINVKRAQEQAAEYGHSLERELAYLTAHAMLHLCGYDHESDEDKLNMRAMEKQAMRTAGIFKSEEKTMGHEDYINLATEALEFSYSPYSNFRVGACLVCEGGEVFQGANFENASLGATICAERCAVSNAIMKGKRRYTKIYIACDKGYAWPCGICRQVLNEFKAGDMEIWAGSRGSKWRMMKLSELLPESFGPEDLGK